MLHEIHATTHAILTAAESTLRHLPRPAPRPVQLFGVTVTLLVQATPAPVITASEKGER